MAALRGSLAIGGLIRQVSGAKPVLPQSIVVEPIVTRSCGMV